MEKILGGNHTRVVAEEAEPTVEGGSGRSEAAAKFLATMKAIMEDPISGEGSRSYARDYLAAE